MSNLNLFYFYSLFFIRLISVIQGPRKKTIGLPVHTVISISLLEFALYFPTSASKSAGQIAQLCEFSPHCMSLCSGYQLNGMNASSALTEGSLAPSQLWLL